MHLFQWTWYVYIGIYQTWVITHCNEVKLHMNIQCRYIHIYVYNDMIWVFLCGREAKLPNSLALTKQPSIPYGWYELWNEGGNTRVFRDLATRCKACQGFYYWNWISGNQQHWHLYLCINSQNECWMDDFINTRRRRQIPIEVLK